MRNSCRNGMPCSCDRAMSCDTDLRDRPTRCRQQRPTTKLSRWLKLKMLATQIRRSSFSVSETDNAVKRRALGSLAEITESCASSKLICVEGEILICKASDFNDLGRTSRSGSSRQLVSSSKVLRRTRQLIARQELKKQEQNMWNMIQKHCSLPAVSDDSHRAFQCSPPSVVPYILLQAFSSLSLYHISSPFISHFFYSLLLSLYLSLSLYVFFNSFTLFLLFSLSLSDLHL